MHWTRIFALVTAVMSVPGQAQTAEPASDPKVPMLAFKLLMRSTRPFVAPGEPLKLEVACVSLPGTEKDWQERWNNACLNARLKIEEARLGGYWGGVDTMAWLQNRLHLCLLPAGESYEEESSQFRYTTPRWHSITVPVKKLSGL